MYNCISQIDKNQSQHPVFEINKETRPYRNF